MPDRRQFLKLAANTAGAAVAAASLPACVRRALQIPPAIRTGTIRDVEHIVILMQENRSFDHYFGTLRGVRGFGDRHPIPLPNGKPVWHQRINTERSEDLHSSALGERLEEGERRSERYDPAEILPFHFDTKITSALRTPGTPHTFDNAQAAWSQGKLDQWPKYKTPMSMGHFRREDIPFQFALAEAFTICDAYHCSVTTGTDPNRIVFWSGSNFDPELRARGINTTDANAEVNNLRCHVQQTVPPARDHSSPSEGVSREGESSSNASPGWTGRAFPRSTDSAAEKLEGGASRSDEEPNPKTHHSLLPPHYSYQGSAFRWPTIPELLERAGISWRIYQDPNDNWQGLMHGCLAFESFRNAKPGDPIYEKGMTGGWLDRFETDIKNNTLPSVSWLLPSQKWSEHPSGSSALQGAEFTTRVLDAFTANPALWSKTVLFLTFDENDGLFDHAPPPAPPSYNLAGSVAGKSTLDLAGMYFNTTPSSSILPPASSYLHPDDKASGPIRPWGLGPRVPMYVISPWSRGGWVNSQVFDHTSFGQFLEHRFGITVPAITPWHRSICGDLTTCFDFGHPPTESGTSTNLPRVTDSTAIVAAAATRPAPEPCRTPTCQLPKQEPGVRPSRALPYELHVTASVIPTPSSLLTPPSQHLKLTFRNTGKQGAVLHVYDRLHLDRNPRRYTIEPDKQLTDTWNTTPDNGHYDLFVLGPNGFHRAFHSHSSPLPPHSSLLTPPFPFPPEITLDYDIPNREIKIIATNKNSTPTTLTIHANAYRTDGPWTLHLPPNQTATHTTSLITSHNWYDLTITTTHTQHRYAGRMETGTDSYSDPAI